jgi:hypothetical protein
MPPPIFQVAVAGKCKLAVKANKELDKDMFDVPPRYQWKDDPLGTDDHI